MTSFFLITLTYSLSFCFFVVVFLLGQAFKRKAPRKIWKEVDRIDIDASGSSGVISVAYHMPKFGIFDRTCLPWSSFILYSLYFVHYTLEMKRCNPTNHIPTIKWFLILVPFANCNTDGWNMTCLSIGSNPLWRTARALHWSATVVQWPWLRCMTNVQSQPTLDSIYWQTTWLWYIKSMDVLIYEFAFHKSFPNFQQSAAPQSKRITHALDRPWPSNQFPGPGSGPYIRPSNWERSIKKEFKFKYYIYIIRTTFSIIIAITKASFHPRRR